MKKILTISLIFVLACRPDTIEVPFRIEFRVTSLEIAMLDREYDNVGLLAGEVEEMIKEVTTLTEVEKNAKGDALRLLGMIKERNYNSKNFEELVLLKEDLMLLLNSNTYQDNHLDALWQFGNSLLFATSTAKDQVLDLYQWNEFVQQVEDMKETWGVLEKEGPSMALLRFDESRSSMQVRLFDDLEKAVSIFFNSVDDGISSTDDLQGAADVLRERYGNYIKMLASIKFSGNADDSLE